MIITGCLISAFLLLAAAYAIFRILFRRDYRQKGQLTPLSALLGTLVWFCWGGFPAIYASRDWPATHVDPILGIPGKIFLWSGLAIMLFGIVQLGLLRAFGRRQTILKQIGFYRFSRNPQIIGCALYGIGFAALWPSWCALIWIALFAPVAHLMVLTEEEHLRKKHGETYVRYCERTPRYLPYKRIRVSLLK